jgi:predicted metal-binding membrane protein
MMRLLPFLAQWTTMMAAMMLPGVLPVAARYGRMIRRHRPLGLAAFAAGYLLVWATVGFPAWLFGRALGQIAHAAALTAAAATISVACALYQFSSLKTHCLAQCRAPVALLLRYASWRGRLRHLRVGLHHGLYCVACCWALFAMLLLLAPASVWAMVAVVAAVIAEKWSRRGDRVALGVAIACLAAAAVVVWWPEVVSGIGPTGGLMEMGK